MSRPLLLDLYCGAGGSAVGYHRAGFDVLGVDIKPQPNFPFRFIQADALLAKFIIEIRGWQMTDFQAIHASPPCTAYSTITPDKSRHERLIPRTRELIHATGLPYVIENVEGAQRELVNPVKLCGSSFGLAVQRHRYFETSVAMMSTPCQHGLQGQPIGVYGDHPQEDRDYRRPDGTRRGQKARDVEHAREAMGIDWMDWPELTQAIPPAYTEYIGAQLLDAIKAAA